MGHKANDSYGFFIESTENKIFPATFKVTITTTPVGAVVLLVQALLSLPCPRLFSAVEQPVSPLSPSP